MNLRRWLYLSPACDLDAHAVIAASKLANEPPRHLWVAEADWEDACARVADLPIDVDECLGRDAWYLETETAYVVSADQLITGVNHLR